MGATGIALLGPLSVNGHEDAGMGPLGPRDRVVLAALAVRPGEVVSTERLADALWGERPPASWNKVVPGCVMRLRRLLGPDAIETTGHGYRLVVPADEIDAQRFERLVGRGRQLLTLGEPERAAHVLGEALALWRGRALVELGEWEPGRIEASRLEELRLDAEEARIEACLQSGQHREVLGEAQSRVAEAPLRERRWGLLALAQYQAGRQGEALRTLRQARTVLASELGLDPGPELVALEQAILRQDPSLVADAVRVVPSATCPYLGLVSYGVRDAEGFFGRDAEVAECLRRLAATQVLAVVGPSGCGKSSLVRAGVAAALERGGRRVVVVSPGARPMSTLEWVPADAHTVLVVDQCEEVLTLCSDGDEQTGFFSTLAERAERGPVVVAIRADRLGDLSAHPAFARIVQRGFVLLGAMGEDDLWAAIEGPARQAGLLLEPGLVDLLVSEVEGEPGALPLLSHALRQTWHEREGRTLTVAGYRTTGGIRGAVANTAEELYERLPGEQRPMLRDLLLRLVAPSPNGEPVRTRVPRRTLTPDAVHEGLIEQLVAARLVTTDGDTVELAHEAVARAWPRLRDWLDDDVDGQRILRHLANAADTWDTMGRPDSELYRGLRLSQAVDWRDRARPTLSSTEEAFLDAGAALADAEHRSTEERARRQVRTNRRLKALLAGVAILLVAAIAAGLLAWRQAERADRAAVVADAGRVAALADNETQADLALLLAVQAMRLDDSPASRASLLTALARRPALIASTSGPELLVAVDVNPDSGRIAVGGVEVSLYDAVTLGELATTDLLAREVAFRPDGEQLAIAADDVNDSRPIRLVDADTLQESPVQFGDVPEPPAEALDLDYSSDGRFLAALFTYYGLGDDLGTVLTDEVVVWDMAAPQRPTLRFDTSAWAAALSPDGRLLYLDAWEGRRTVIVYDATTGRRLRSIHEPIESHGIANPDDTVDLLEVSSDGTTLAVGDGGDVLLMDASTLAVQHRLTGPTERVQSVEFSHEGTMVAAGSDDGTITVWDVVDGTQRAELHGDATPVSDLAFSPDDTIVYSAADKVLAWDLGGDHQFIRRIVDPEPQDPFSSRVLPAPDGEAVAYFTEATPGERQDALQFRDLATGRLGQPIATGDHSSGLAWRPPDAEQFATIDGDGVVRVFLWRHGEQVAERKVAQERVGGIAYRADGQRLVIGERSGAVFQVDADTLEPIGDRIEVDGTIRGIFATPTTNTVLVLLSGGSYALVDFVDGTVVKADLSVDPASLDVSPDGTLLAVGAGTGEVGVADIRTGEWVRPPTDDHAGWVQRVTYAPDGNTFISSGNDGQVKVWDGRTGQLLATIAPGGSNVWASVEFLPDAHTITVATRDGSVYEWDTRVESWIKFACRVAGRNLTDAEWREALRDRPYQETCP
jgi:WD40 repeat protein/DNA-binding SARP family transcriptional activator/energy-coupling factor transporter ATP-binding protein EcfA2